MAFDSHIVTVRRLKKYIDDVIGKKANLPNNKNTIVGNLVTLNSDLSDCCKQSTLLWSGSITNGGTATLNDSFRNYKKVALEFALSNNNTALALVEISTAIVRSDFYYYYSWLTSSVSDTSNSVAINFMNNTTIKVDAAYGRGAWDSPPYLKRVYGIN
jgi:hypothetical protein